MLKTKHCRDKLTAMGGGFVWLLADDDFDSYYVIKIFDDLGERYFFSARTFVSDIGLAKKFNTVRSAKRSIKLLENLNCQIEKLKRNNF